MEISDIGGLVSMHSKQVYFTSSRHSSLIFVARASRFWREYTIKKDCVIYWLTIMRIFSSSFATSALLNPIHFDSMSLSQVANNKAAINTRVILSSITGGVSFHDNIAPQNVALKVYAVITFRILSFLFRRSS